MTSFRAFSIVFRAVFWARRIRTVDRRYDKLVGRHGQRRTLCEEHQVTKFFVPGIVLVPPTSHRYVGVYTFKSARQFVRECISP